MILIKDKYDTVHVFSNVEFVLEDDGSEHGYVNVRRLYDNRLIYKCLTRDIKELIVD